MDAQKVYVDLYTELCWAHLIIANALRVTSAEQRIEWAKLNAESGATGKNVGAMRIAEREQTLLVGSVEIERQRRP